MNDLAHVPLEARHIELGGKMVPFSGFLMPVQFTGIKDEHAAVRQRVGLFDVSHMGEVEFRGPDALAAVDRLLTNDVHRLVNGQAMYTAMCNDDGGIIDDLVVYRLADDHVMICVNAANRHKDFKHLSFNAVGDVAVTDTSDDWAQLALQGPDAAKVLGQITQTDLTSIAYYHAAWGDVAGAKGILISRTGYTGEDGFELYIPVASAVTVFDAILAAGDAHGLSLCGLGCRDTLRLESKYLLYGNDMDESTNPVEAGLNWVIKLDREANFTGRRSIEILKATGPTRRLRGLILEGRGVIRQDYELYAAGSQEKIGNVTSGSYAPTLEQSIGLGYIDIAHANDDVVDVDIRGRRVPARVTKKPFYKRS